jgi:imidazolonepropionase-like amidohydrolase
MIAPNILGVLASLVAAATVVASRQDAAPGESAQPTTETSTEQAEPEPEPDPYPHAFETDELRKPITRTGGNVLIRGAMVHDAMTPARVADVLVVDGKIVAIAQGLAPRDGMHVVDGSGLHLAPGVVDAHSHMAIGGGVNEGTVSISAEVDMADVVDPKDRSLYGALSGGCTTIQILHGSANAIGGQAALLKLRFDSTEDRLLVRDAPKGIKFALGENPKRSNWGAAGERFPGSRLGVEALYYRAFERAREYAAERVRVREQRAAGGDPAPVRRDLRLDALVAVLDGDLVVHAHSYRADEILMLMRAAEQYGFRVGTFHHVLEGYKVAR